LLFATVAVTASDQFLSFDYIGPMSGTLGKASRLTSSAAASPEASRDGLAYSKASRLTHPEIPSQKIRPRGTIYSATPATPDSYPLSSKLRAILRGQLLSLLHGESLVRLV
jgi:hypothetical protein